MMKTLFDDDYELPVNTKHANALVWVLGVEDEDETEHPTGLVILDGPAWVRTVELFDPTYRGVPDTLVPGLYVFDVTCEHEVDRYGEEENVEVLVHRTMRVAVPSRQRLVDAPFEDFLGVVS